MKRRNTTKKKKLTLPKLERLRTVITLSDGREMVILDLSLGELESFAFLQPTPGFYSFGETKAREIK